MYHCRLDVPAASDLSNLLPDDLSECSPLSFDHEWLPQRVLLPEMAVILVISTQLPTFIEYSEHEFVFFVHYELASSHNSTIDELQLHCGHLKVNSSALYGTHYRPTFSTDKIFQDLLAIIATTTRLVIVLSFEDEITENSVNEFLVGNMKFTQITSGLTQDAQDAMDIDNYIDNLVDVDDCEQNQSMPEKSQKHRLRPCDTFFYPQDGHFKGTLVRRYKHSTQRHVFKVYSKSSATNFDFVQVLRQQFGPSASIDTAGEYVGLKVNELANVVRKEAQFFNTFDCANGNVETFIRDRCRHELNTDLLIEICNKICPK